MIAPKLLLRQLPSLTRLHQVAFARYHSMVFLSSVVSIFLNSFWHFIRHKKVFDTSNWTQTNDKRINNLS
ncbi:hypothetical protein [uncultured Gammaproteobacteria bacterium]|nr:hypothetical protein [uncultured Gammaproteobacteria bacterium]